MRMLHAAVTAGPSGPVIALAGEADLTTAAELNQLLAAQLDGGTTHLTVDLSGLRFADSAAIRELIHAHRAITQRGGTLELTRPQPVVARVLSLLGVDQILTSETRPERPGHEPAAGDRGLTGTHEVGCPGRPRVASAQAYPDGGQVCPGWRAAIGNNSRHLLAAGVQHAAAGAADC